jgi:hypothetical protein
VKRVVAGGYFLRVRPLNALQGDDLGEEGVEPDERVEIGPDLLLPPMSVDGH